MKWILALLVVNFAYATSQSKKYDVDENHHPQREEQVSKKYDREDVNAKVKQEQQENKINDDADPELDGIDDDLTVDEGLNDD